MSFWVSHIYANDLNLDQRYTLIGRMCPNCRPGSYFVYGSGMDLGGFGGPRLGFFVGVQ